MKIVLALWAMAFSANVISANWLNLYLFPSPSTYNWNSPGSLTRSVVKNTIIPTKYLYRHALGHVSVEVICEKTSFSDSFYQLTGMTMAENSEDSDLILKKKIGLGVMFYPMKGRLQTDEEVYTDMQDRLGSKKLNWLKFKINNLACMRIKRYLEIYQNENLDRTYGLVFNPRKREGAGCSAFAISFLELAGLMRDEFKLRWSRRFFANHNLNGYNGGIDEISILKLMFGKNSKKWGTDSRDGKEIFFWEPNLIYKWINETYKRESKYPTGIYSLERYGKSIGLMRDMTSKLIPIEPIFID